ncbi:GGDEF domain-containing protein [Sporomusa malonica]|uniref:Diguanylate cyclase (GGDEF) domain-containing protein n=1 Tax=Sporomusa malonica TaxID=112901 RepID=A0A1W2ELB8_9FIRM|nr:GGDEF domain-containing protein [Sporomusa malonica]SMD10510.1 diguanylate cyclase (GGDEF) domain-containing protein [Sporomusa malonica]
MSAINRVHAARVWGDSASQLQIVTRRISTISAMFTLVATVLNPSTHWALIVVMSVIYVIYNTALSWRRSKPQLGELMVNLALCAGLTIVGAVYSNVLYHLLLLRMVLKVGRDRAMRMAVAVSFVYLAANMIKVDSVAAAFLLETIYNVIGFAVLSFTAVYMHNVMETQMRNEGQIAELMRQNAHHYQMAHTDGLTGLLNHRAYLEKTADLPQYVLLIVDIDHFKKLNDTYGHLFGDQVLTTIGNIIKMSIRNKDMAFRYGGEEFALVLPGTSLDLGLKIAERLRYQVANCEFFHNSEQVKVTISIGVSRKNPSVACQDAFREADSALYRAKRQGRNQCAVF